MGVDAEIWIETDGEPEDLWAPEGFYLQEAGEYEKQLGYTHEVWSGARYYGIGYERGPWPVICGVLMSLLASPNVKRVLYFGDNRDMEGVEQLTAEEVIRISAHYMKHGERPHRDSTYKMTMQR